MNEYIVTYRSEGVIVIRADTKAEAAERAKRVLEGGVMHPRKKNVVVEEVHLT